MNYLTKIKQLKYLSETEKDGLKSVVEEFAFRCINYYLSLVNWDYPESERYLIFSSNPNAYWLDNYDEMIADYPVELPYRYYGPE